MGLVRPFDIHKLFTGKKCRIRNVLEGIFSFQPHIPEMQMVGTHYKIFAFGSTAPHFHAAYRPAKLRGNNVAAGQLSQLGILQCQPAVVLKRIPEVEKAVPDSQVSPFLKGAFIIGRAIEFAAGHGDILCTVQYAFFVKNLVHNRFHEKFFLAFGVDLLC